MTNLKQYLNIYNITLNIIIIVFLVIFVRAEYYDKNLHEHKINKVLVNEEGEVEHNLYTSLRGVHSHKKGKDRKYSNTYEIKDEEYIYEGRNDDIIIYMWKAMVISIVLITTAMANKRLYDYVGKS